MQLPLQISTRNLRLATPDEAVIRRSASKLDGLYERIVGCRVLAEAEHRFASGSDVAYRVRIDLTLPGGELVVTRQAQPELLTAVQEAFNAAQRRLEDYARRQRGHVKRPVSLPEGRVVRLFPFEGYGFISTVDGREIYFHRNSVLRGAFGRLQVGSRVRFVEESGVQGPQASTVTVAGPRRRHQRHLRS